MFTPITGLPGIGTAKTSTPVNIFAGNEQFTQFIPGGKMISGANSRDGLNVNADGTTDYDVLRAGVMLGKITATGKYRPAILGVTVNALTSATNQTTIYAAAGVVAEVQRLITAAGTSIAIQLTGPPTASGTVASGTTTASAGSGTSITCAYPGTAFVAGSLIQPYDGSQTILTVQGDAYGTKVSDSNGNSVDVLANRLTLRGHLNTAKLVNYPADSSLKTWVKAALNAAGSYTFSDSF